MNIFLLMSSFLLLLLITDPQIYFFFFLLSFVLHSLSFDFFFLSFLYSDKSMFGGLRYSVFVASINWISLLDMCNGPSLFREILFAPPLFFYQIVPLFSPTGYAWIKGVPIAFNLSIPISYYTDFLKISKISNILTNIYQSNFIFLSIFHFF